MLALYLAMAAEEAKGGRRAVACAGETFNSCLHSSLPYMPWQLSGCLIGNAGDVPKICSFGCLKDEEGFCVLFPLALALEKNAAALVPGQKEGGALERK